jgi:hypothetical protein
MDPSLHPTISHRSREQIVADHLHAVAVGPMSDSWLRDAAWALRSTSSPGPGHPAGSGAALAIEEIVARIARSSQDELGEGSRVHGVEGDAWRIWGLGAASLGAAGSGRADALDGLEAHVGFASTDLRANALAALGCAQVLRAYPQSALARMLLVRTSRALVGPRPDEVWPWPEPRLGEVNAVVPDAFMSAGAVLGDVSMVGSGLRLLRWLVAGEMAERHFSFTSSRGHALSEVGPRWPQSVDQAATMTTACANAFRVTGDLRWARAARRAAGWFNGLNDLDVTLVDTWHGRVADALDEDGPSATSTAAAFFAARVARLDATRLSAHAGKRVDRMAGAHGVPRRRRIQSTPAAPAPTAATPTPTATGTEAPSSPPPPGDEFAVDAAANVVAGLELSVAAAVERNGPVTS